MNKSHDYRKDEIDFLDILAVIIKRKWIIIGLTIIAIIFSTLYVRLRSKVVSQFYKATIIVALPQEYRVEGNNLLSPMDTQKEKIYKTIKDELNMKLYKDGVKNDYEINIIGNSSGNSHMNKRIMGDIEIKIRGQKKEEIIKTVSYLLTLYNRCTTEIHEKNNRISELVQGTLQKTLDHKKTLLDRCMLIIEQGTALNSSQESIVLSNFTNLSSEIPMIEKTIELNKMLELSDGDFKLVTLAREMSIRKDNITNVENYLELEIVKSSVKGKRFLVVVSVFLALFIGICLAFVIEFFSREDVKKRLKEKLE